MGYPILLGQSAKPLVFGPVVLSSDHISAATGKTLTVTISKDGAAFATPAGAVTEIGNGYYQIAGNATDSGTAGPLVVNATGTGCDPFNDMYPVVGYDPWDAAGLGLSRLDAAVSSRLAAASYTAPDNTSVAAIKTQTDKLLFDGSSNVKSTPQTGVTVTTNNDKTGYGLTASERDAAADALLNRDLNVAAGGSASGRTVRQAFNFLRNKWSTSSGLTVYETDDTTVSWQAALTTNSSAVPIVTSDPA